MKKFLAFLMAAAMVGSMAVTAVAEEAAEENVTVVAEAVEEDVISVEINGEKVVFADAKPFIDENSRVLVPLRAIGVALGLEVEWDGESRVATFIGGDKKVAFTIDSAEYEIVEGEDVQKAEMDTKAIISEERIYAPVRYLAEAFGFVVSWDGETNTVSVKTPEPADEVEEVEEKAEEIAEEVVEEKQEEKTEPKVEVKESSKKKAKWGRVPFGAEEEEVPDEGDVNDDPNVGEDDVEDNPVEVEDGEAVKPTEVGRM